MRCLETQLLKIQYYSGKASDELSLKEDSPRSNNLSSENILDY